MSDLDDGPSEELAGEIAAATAKLARQEAAAAKTRQRLESLEGRQAQKAAR